MSNPTTGYQPPSTTSVAKDEAAGVGQSAKEATSQVASTATEQAKDVAAETKRQAKDLIGQAGTQVTEQAGAQKEKAVSGLRSIADELRSMAEGNGAQNGMAGDLARQAAEKAHEFAGWLDQRDPGSLVEEIRQLARRKPGSFLIGAALAGIAAGRLTRGAIAASGSTDSGPAVGTGYAPTPIGDEASTAVYSTTTGSDSFSGQSAAGARNPSSGPLVVEPERTSVSQGATGSGLGMEEERR
jgi:hypothetical protein